MLSSNSPTQPTIWLPFARDLGYDGPPFQWDEYRRLYLRAKLDALFFHLYGITDRNDIRYIYSTFPIVARQETAAYDRYLSRDLCLAWMNALAAGDPGCGDCAMSYPQACPCENRDDAEKTRII